MNKNDFFGEMRTEEQDYAYGVKNEKEIEQKLRERFDTSLKRIENTFARFDFEGDKCIIEMKSRYCNVNSYETTIINKSKIDYYLKLNTNKKLYFLFRFRNGDKYIRFSRKKFEKYKIDYITRRDRDKIEKQLYYFVDVDDLNEL